MSSETIVDLNPEVTYPPTTRSEVLSSIRDIVHRRTGVDLSGEMTVKVDPATDEVTISLCGVTLSDGGDIVPAKREYGWVGTVTIEMTVRGTVEAADEDEAEERAADILSYIDVNDDPELSDVNGDTIEVDDYSVIANGEVDRVSEV